MCLDVCTISAMASLALFDKPVPAADITALVVTDTSDRSNTWTYKFAESIGMRVVGWQWDRKLKVWDLVLEQVGPGRSKPMAEVHMYFADGNFGYILSLLEYRPLFWMGQTIKFGPEVNKRHPIQETTHERDTGKEVAAIIRKLSYACKDDLDPTDRLVRLLNELHRAYPLEFRSVGETAIDIEIEGTDLYQDYLVPLAAFGYTAKMFSGSTPAKRRITIEAPKLKTGR